MTHSDTLTSSFDPPQLRADFAYDLPEHLIADQPSDERTASRLLVWDPVAKSQQHHQFRELSDFINPDDCLIFNNTKVQKARLTALKETGGQVEVFCERVWDDVTATALIKASKAPKLGARLTLISPENSVLPPAFLEVVAVDQKPFYKVRSLGLPIAEVLEHFGEVPLPPYIKRSPNREDSSRYQTVFAEHLGSAAAPTAGLHFDQKLIGSLSANGVASGFVTLHVGLGTFQPVRCDDLSDHVMHSEWLQVPQSTVEQIQQTRAKGGRVIAVGTTALRALESAAKAGEAGAAGELAPYTGDSDLFITPGYEFKVVDALITNFHLPESTLLMLVSAFAGFQQTQQTYRDAIAAGYRFFSYGDAMFITARYT